MNRSPQVSILTQRAFAFLAALAVTGLALGWLTADPDGNRFSLIRASWFTGLLVVAGLLTTLLDAALPAWSDHPRWRAALLFGFGFTLFRVGAAWINGNHLLEPMASGAISGAITGAILGSPRMQRYLGRYQQRRG